MNEGLAERFEAKVDRSGEHHLWTGARKADGAGVLKVSGKLATAHRVAWELAHGALPPGSEVRSCAAVKACVRLDHLMLRGAGTPTPSPGSSRKRAAKGSGSKIEIRPGVWKFTVNAGRYEDGSPRRLHRTVHADTGVDAAHELAAFVAEAQSNPQLDHKADRDITVDDLMDQYLTEHLRGDKGREPRTVEDYRRLHAKWFSPEIGSRRVRDVDEDTMDRIFGRMRRAGLSHARMHHAKSIYTPFFRWAKRRRIITRNPMADFDLPTSRYVSRERVPPEVSQLCLLLETAVKLVPDVAPIPGATSSACSRRSFPTYSPAAQPGPSPELHRLPTEGRPGVLPRQMRAAESASTGSRGRRLSRRRRPALRAALTPSSAVGA